MERFILMIIGVFSLILGGIAAFVPLVLSFPFLLLTAILFGKSFERLNRWFKNHKLYKNNLESYVNKKGMTKSAKVRLILVVSLTMLIGFVMLGQIVMGQLILLIVWLGHIAYFLWGVKTINP